ncbi:Crp/Fnr family transcriptional regulator [Bacillus sp. FJAT-49736]|uniref:Crp/Fnr family transcriptional regulator n=1 Tax=Bacillus sp. FJAT-49736 TaxID=2833582 RepID=UPI001BCA4061|nr:Crp/Fnr family transcriptional regulator [Bacillus sp. FJAT-49736]MBS4173117.1 Crp/Fnr family transcriptional regulator [Bacillus sp. FJAT-49736]
MITNVQPLKPTHSIQIKELLKFTERIITAKKGAYIFQEGIEGEGIFIILNGKVQISKITPDGQELTFRICSHNDIIGEGILFSYSPKYILTAKVLEDCQVALIRKEIVENEIFKDGALALEFMKWMSDQYRRTQTKFRDLLLNGKKGALYSTLIRMTNSYGIEKKNGILIDIHITNQDLANFCGTARESINRMLSELKKDGIISIHHGEMTIHDLQYLKDAIHCEECPITYCSIE